ncbi:hypothetical protein HDU93_006057 [Gonapodya sp. JEL0774]|nr:hypothetical protein HDU93_006057 [Gonapodya sp. JEL0774]
MSSVPAGPFSDVEMSSSPPRRPTVDLNQSSTFSSTFDEGDDFSHSAKRVKLAGTVDDGRTRGATGDHDVVAADGGDGVGNAPPATKLGTAFPISRIKKIMKEDREVGQISGDAVWLVGAATELFLEFLIHQSHHQTQRTRRKIISYADLAAAVDEVEQLEFLRDAIPPTLPPTTALAAAALILNDATSDARAAAEAAELANEEANRLMAAGVGLGGGSTENGEKTLGRFMENALFCENTVD